MTRRQLLGSRGAAAGAVSLSGYERSAHAGTHGGSHADDHYEYCVKACAKCASVTDLRMTIT